MVLLDVFYLMPTYLPGSDVIPPLISQSWIVETDDLVWPKFLVSLMRFWFGPIFIFVAAIQGNIAFGTSFVGTAAASATVFYVLMIPYLLALSFFIPGKTSVPPGYRFFQFFIARSGSAHLDRSLGERGPTFDTAAFKRDTLRARSDRHQAKMEAEELEAAAARARADAQELKEKAEVLHAEELQRIRMAEEAARAAEVVHRSKSRLRAWKRQKDRD